MSTAVSADVLAAFPWVADKFAPLKSEQGGRYLTTPCPLRVHDVAAVRLWVRDGVLCFGCYRACNKTDILRAVGATWRDCFPGGVAPERLRQDVTARYVYRDERGDALYETLRLEPGRGGRDKDFRQRRPDGAAGWAWNLDGVRRVLYRLPDLLAADRREPAVVAAGEKDCEALAGVGVLATTNVCGERAEWLPSYSQALAGRPVVVVADADATGRRHCDEVVGSLVRHGAAAVTPVELPRKDAADFLSALRRDGVVSPDDLRRAFWRAVRAAGPRWCPIPLGAC